MNHLQHETSPYLLQHAHNPVDWYAWKPEAFEKAQREDKPILVSIGYSTCHWCHVMERESFEDQEVAAFMNEHFVCIKVDREERPDVDQIYMEACQVMTGGGGWPLNCFLTTDKKPFFAGTYYPPMPAHNRPSWLQVLMSISHAYQNKRETVEDQAKRLTEIIQNAESRFTENKMQIITDGYPFDTANLMTIFSSLEKQFDKINGGFGGAPKFPGTMNLHYLLGYHYYFGEEKALRQMLLSLDKMAMGGIYDQLGGGFARYATDAKWLAPHFEKMLYDNALLVGLLADAYKVTKKDLYKETIEETLSWVQREMTSTEGGFFSALDADSEGVEGKFYVWQKNEVEEVLGKEAQLFCEFYDVTEHGNWEERNILWRRWTFEEFADKKDLKVADLKKMLADGRRRLFEAREKRIRPGLDDKVLLGWNALMCSAYASAYAALGNDAYRKAAVSVIEFIFDKMQQSDGITLYHTYKDGRAQYDAFLDDYAYLIDALIGIYEITFDTSYLLQAGRYTGFVLQHFLDKEDKMFYFTSSKQQDIPMRKKDLYDSATPSGNSTMVRNLQRLGILIEEEAYRSLASEMLLKIKSSIERYPSSFGQWSCAFMQEAFGMPEIAVVGEKAFDVAKEINRDYLPGKVLMASLKKDPRFPLLAEKETETDTLIYVCQNYTCQRPVATIEAFRQLLEENKSSYHA